VLLQTLRRYTGLGLLLLVGSSRTWAAEPREGKASITVSVYDDAGVGLHTLLKAEEVSSLIFQKAGVTVHWLNCGVDGKLTHVAYSCGAAEYPRRLQLRIIQKSRNVTAATFGISYLSGQGEGCYSQVFLEPVEQLRATFSIELGTLLGHVATHELAHLLLGTNSHSASGIMRAHWGPKELVSASMGGLLFRPDQGDKMLQHLAAGIRNEQTTVAESPAVGSDTD
jgi:hypothetical protein